MDSHATAPRLNRQNALPVNSMMADMGSGFDEGTSDQLISEMPPEFQLTAGPPLDESSDPRKLRRQGAFEREFPLVSESEEFEEREIVDNSVAHSPSELGQVPAEEDRSDQALSRQNALPLDFSIGRSPNQYMKRSYALSSHVHPEWGKGQDQPSEQANEGAGSSPKLYSPRLALRREKKKKLEAEKNGASDAEKLPLINSF